MTRQVHCLAAAFALTAVAAANAGEPFRSGSYEIAWRLELPHVEAGEGGSATVCLSDTGAFPVLSANNPLAHCPARNIRRDGRQTSFEIVCPGGNAAKAAARFETRGDAFEGRIEMNMGGKNMTMTESQRGRRVGDCPAEPARPH